MLMPISFLKWISLVLVLLAFPLQNVWAQEVEDIDEAFMEARELAFAGEREKARELAYKILKQSPDYHDVRILVARTYSWDGEYSKAREELQYVLERSPEYKDALLASVDNEIWAERYSRAVQVAKKANKYYPLDERVLLKRVDAHYAAGEEQDALRVLNQIEEINPSNKEALERRKRIKSSLQNYTLTIAYTQDRFEELFDTAHKSYIQLSRRTPYGPVIGRLNYHERFSTGGLQPEIDYYPTIAAGWYGYLSIGFASSSILPGFRSGVEIYKKLPQAFEVSAGFRYLNFSNDVWIYTGTVTKYQGSWLFTVRPYFTPSSIGTSRSINFLARRYFSGPENYISLRGGFGFIPEERRFQDVSGDVFLTSSQYLGIDGFKALKYDLAIFLSVDVGKQELVSAPDTFIQVLTLKGGIEYKF